MPRPHLVTFGNIHCLPVLHYRVEFAWLAAEAFRQLDPDCVALELPHTLGGAVRRGVQRLPQVSVVASSCEGGDSYLLIEPADPLCEGARLALEHDLPLAFIDSDVDSYPSHCDPLPDSYAVRRIGLRSYYEAVAAADTLAPCAADRLREMGMAFRLQELSGYRRVLFICGMSHVERVRELYLGRTARPLERLERQGVRLLHLHADSCREVLGEEPYVNAAWELRRLGLPEEPAPAAPLRRRFGILELVRGGREQGTEEEAVNASLARIARGGGSDGDMPDRQRFLYRLFHEAARHYREETGERLHHWQRRLFFRYCRNLALVEGRLLPPLFDALAAARSCVDDNFAYAVWRLAAGYPFQLQEAELPSIRLRPEDLGGTRTIRFRPRKKSGKGLAHLSFLNRKREKRPGEWLEGFDSAAVCSYPPEDLLVEGYGDFLKKKGIRQLSEERGRVEPLTASLLDGIDMRETLRNLHEGRIYVREFGRLRGAAGSVVLIFDEDREGRRYPNLMTWLGEHDQESDMAFYATQPAENVVGPGITRCEYGGFLLSYPPRRLADVWHDPDYAFARSKAEVLLLAALDYCREEHVVYAAPRPPRSALRQLAGRMGKKIVYLPLGTLSPVQLRKLRVFHVLFGHDKREIGRDYIW